MNRTWRRGVLILALLAGAACQAETPTPMAASAEEAGPTRFIVFGDLQDTSEAGRAADRRLIAQINALGPAFSVYIGDIKGGGGDCSDELLAEMSAIFADHDAPLIFTPGDNEWTDCWREDAGGHDPLERQAAVVDLFTAEGVSLGQSPRALEQQEGRRENARWTEDGVVFVTLHMTGSNNNLRQNPAAVEEHFARDADNLEWLTQTFESAEAKTAAGMVIITHANPQWDARWWEPTGFDAFRAALRDQAAAFDRPILVVHGDTHTFRIDQPFRDVPNLTRLEVFGPPDRGAVLVELHPSEAEVFRISPSRLRP